MAYSAPTGNVTGITDVYGFVDSTVSGLFFPSVMFAMFMVIFIKLLFKTDNIGQSFAAASFIVMIGSVLLRVADLVGTQFMVLWIVATGVGAIWMHYENARFN